MKYVTRAGWGARPPKDEDQVQRVTWAVRTEFFVHHTEGPTSQTARSIQDFHQGGRGWNDIGYGHLVGDDGVIYEGRGWLVVGAHCPGHNRTGESVAYIGQDNPTPAALRSIRWLYDEACRRAGKRLLALGHGQRFATACPGRRLQAWVSAGMPLSEEDEVGATELWQHELEVPFGSAENPDWQAGNLLVNHGVWLRKIAAKVDAQTAQLDAQGAAIRELAAALAQRDDEIDVEALVNRIEAAIGSIKVRLDVGEVAPGG